MVKSTQNTTISDKKRKKGIRISFLTHFILMMGKKDGNCSKAMQIDNQKTKRLLIIFLSLIIIYCLQKCL